MAEVHPEGGIPAARVSAVAQSHAPTDLDALFRQERDQMVRLAVVLVGSSGAAEEIVQDAFEAVGRRWSRLTNPGGYLRVTVVNGCRMRLRRRALEARHLADVSMVLEGPAELVELHDALSRLTERARVAVVLRYLIGLDDVEIAEILDCRPATVRSITHRALRVLRKELS